MRKDTNKDIDLLFKEGLEDAAVKAPRGVWKAVSARLDSAAPAAAAAPKRSWLLWGAPAFAFAAAALAAVIYVGNTERTIINSGEELITVTDAQPSGPVAMAEENVMPDVSHSVMPDADRASGIGTRAGFVPKEIQNPDQITVLPSNDVDSSVEARSAKGGISRRAAGIVIVKIGKSFRVAYLKDLSPAGNFRIFVAYGQTCASG